MCTYLEKPGHILSGGNKVHGNYETGNNPAEHDSMNDSVITGKH